VNQYILKQPVQLTAFVDLDVNGELQWRARPMETWQQKMFPKRYEGDFSEQWQMLICEQKYGIGFKD